MTRTSITDDWVIIILVLGNYAKIINHPKFKELTDVRNIALYIFGLIVLAITWSGVKTLQNNYELQRKISTLQQQNQVIKLQNENTALQNQYYKTNEYMDLAARQDLGLAAPGEKVMLVPKAVAMKYVDQSLAAKTTATASAGNQSKYIQNLEAWRDFLTGRKPF